MDTTNKRYVHDHVSSYKNRGEKLGSSNRFVRAHRANEDRKALRLDEITKRRGLVLSLVNECNLSLEENRNQKKTTAKAKDKALGKAKEAKSSSKENVPKPQVTDERKAMLLKWREQRELKRKAETAKKQQKGVFAVRHIQHDTAPFTAKPTKTSPKKPKSASVPPAKRVTRSSARLASKQPAVQPEAKGRPASSRKEMSSTKKPVTVNKVNNEGVPKRVTRQSVKTKTSSSSAKKATGDDTENGKNNHEEKSLKDNCYNQPDEPEQKVTPLAKKKQQRKSFAPPNFQFTAPSGIHSFEHYSKEFKFQPLSPASTENFFKGLVPTIPTPENQRQLITKNNFSLRNKDVENEHPVPMSEEAGDNTSETSSANEKDFGSGKGKGIEQGNEEVECQEDNQLSSKYFRDLVSSETGKLNLICEKWEKEMETDNEIPEEAKGNIRTAIGQAQLLISQRFKQFSGLIDLSEDEGAEKKATMSDLQGFWDMIYFQVEDVHMKMDSLEKAKAKKWIVENKQVTRGGKKIKKTTTAKCVGKRDAKPAGKSRIQEMRAAMRAKMAEKKKQMQAEDGESTSFITVLTPVKKLSKKSGLAGKVVLTPVRRSLRNTPIGHSGTPRVTPKVVSTPKKFGKKSPGLRLTPESLAVSPCNTGSDELSKEKIEDDQENTDVQEMKVESLSSDPEAQASDDLSTKNNDGTIKSTDEDMEKDEVEVFSSTKRRSCLRFSTKKKRKSSRVFFQSPQSSAKSTAGGTLGSLVLTPGAQGNVQSTRIMLTPVAVSFDSPTVEGSTCSLNAGHTPAPSSARKSNLRKRASNGTPVRRSSRHYIPVERDTSSSDSAPEISTLPKERPIGTPSCVDSVDKEITGRAGSERRSLRRSCKKSAANEKAEFLPSKYFLSSTSSEEDGDDNAASPVLAGKQLLPNSQSLVTFTPVKDSNRLNQSCLTPSTMFKALSLDDSEKRRDSVFFAPCGSLMDDQPVKENLICFSPVTE